MQPDRWPFPVGRARSWLAALLLPLLPAGAWGQQIYINSMWVSNASKCVGPTPNGQYYCPGPQVFPFGSCPDENQGANISNNPHLEFDRFAGNEYNTCKAIPQWPNGALPPGSSWTNICSNRIFLCVNIGFSNKHSGNTDFALDIVSFELFKFGSGSNPLDPQSTPPLRTFFIDAPGDIKAGQNGTMPSKETCEANAGAGIREGCGYCVMWDGSINILGELGKSNGTYGFRAKVETNQTGASGNINITQVRAYPSGTTLELPCNPGNAIEQKPITVDVTNVHVVRTSSTIVGSITGVAAEPYNLTYRVSKDAWLYITISNTTDATLPLVRTLVNDLPRVGEGTPDGSLQNGDAWNGRHDNGDLMPPGVYLATLQAYSRDQYGFDLSAPVTRQISLDPLQITDILVQPLANQSTSLAVLTYTLTEPATVYVDIYPPGTQFCRFLNDVNDAAIIPDALEPNPPKDFQPRLGACGGEAISPIKRIMEQKDFRKPVVSFWDGRDRNGAIVPDGDYVFLVYAALPSQNGFRFRDGLPDSDPNDRRIWSSTAKTGFITVARGMVGISQIGPATTVVGSSPSVAGLNPFIFSYSLSREAMVSLKILDQNGLRLRRTLVNNQVRAGNFLNREIWSDMIDNDGQVFSSGTYMVQLTAADPFFPPKVSTTTAFFPLDFFRVVDVAATPLLTGSTDVIMLNYQLSQPMNAAWNIYPPGTIITGSTATWPPCAESAPGVYQITPGVCGQTTNNNVAVKPMISVSGMRPGRLKITEFWDGRDSNGLFVPDGIYPFTIAALSTTTPRYFATDRVMGQLTVARGSIVFPTFTIKPTVPTMVNSSQTLTLPPFEMDYSLTRQSSVTIRVLDTKAAPRIVRTVLAGQVRDGGILNQDFWDGRDDKGNFVTPGFYTIQAIAEDLASVLSSGSTVQQTIAVNPLRIYDVAISPLLRDTGSALISYQVSETMKVSVKIYRPGTTFDVNGNPNPAEARSLVKRIVGVRPSRVEIQEFWDGKDERQSLLPDGNYIFKIVASTDLAAIDTITGAVLPGASLAEDLVVAEVPVVRGDTQDPYNEFEANTFMYPNPVTGPKATFEIYLPFQSDVSVRIYNIAGELVYERSFRNRARSVDAGPIVFDWRRANNSGKEVAPGVYFVLIRQTETLGGANVLQTVKKMLVQ